MKYTAGNHSLQLRVQDSEGYWSDFTKYDFSVSKSTITTIVSEDFSSNTLNTNIWNTYILGSSSLNVENGKLKIVNSNSSGYYTGANFYLKNSMDAKGIITVEYDWTKGDGYGNLGQGLSFYKVSSTSARDPYYGAPLYDFVSSSFSFNSSFLYKKTSPSDWQYEDNYITLKDSKYPLFYSNTTYNVKTVIDFYAKTFYVYINGNVAASADYVQMTNPLGCLGSTIGINFSKANYNTNSIDYFDNIKITQQIN